MEIKPFLKIDSKVTQIKINEMFCDYMLFALPQTLIEKMLNQNFGKNCKVLNSRYELLQNTVSHPSDITFSQFNSELCSRLASCAASIIDSVPFQPEIKKKVINDLTKIEQYKKSYQMW